MRPTFLGFETGRKGLVVAQKGLDITGQNLMNMSTPGYTRQRIDQVSVATANYRSRFAGTRVDFAGQGVEITGISQTRDSFLDKRFREEFSDNYYYTQKTNILTDIANVVDEYANADSGILSSINAISKALQQMSNVNAEDKASANILMTAFKGMASMLKEYDNKLNQAADQQKYDLGLSVNNVNDILNRIAGLNTQIRADVGMNPSGENVYGPNELMDERNLLLDDLSRYGNIDVKSEPDGTITVKMGGHQVVKGSECEKVNYTQHPAGTVSLTWQTTGKESVFGSGSLKAATELINGRGPNIQTAYETPEKGILYYKDRINSLAQTLADTVNSIIPLDVDANGDPVPNAQGVIEYKVLLGAMVTDVNGRPVTTTQTAITAANISISDEWNADSTYVIPRDKSYAGKYFTAMDKALKSDENLTFYNNGQVYTGSLIGYVNDISNTCNGDLSFNIGRMDATGAVADELLNRRDAVMGVSKDEETTNMLMYQKSFQAISRLITAMDEALDVIINRMGVVGR